mgnify:CR=1 FL=1
MRKKKILVGALAVVLAVSMLTACGGPENGGNGGSDTEQKPSSQPDQGDGKEDGKDDGDKGNGTESPVEPVTGKSRTEKYFARVQDVGVKYHSAVEYWKNGGGDAHGVLDVAVLLFPVGGGGHAVIGHQPDGVVDGVHEDTDILDH